MPDYLPYELEAKNSLVMAGRASGCEEPTIYLFTALVYAILGLTQVIKDGLNASKTR